MLNIRLSPDDIRNYDIPARFGGRVDADDLRQFKEQVAREVELLTEERLNAQRFPAAEAAAQQATHILVHARRTAEDQVRMAQAQVREMATEAQDLYDQIVADGHAARDEILIRANGQAEAIVAEAAARFPADAQAQIAFLDSFAELIASQLTHAVEVIRNRRPNRPDQAMDGVPA